MRVTAKVEEDALPDVLKALKANNIMVKAALSKVGRSEIAFELIGTYNENTVKQVIEQAVVNYRLKNVDNWDMDGLRNLTKQQLLTHIDNNVVDLASAKVYIKKLSLVTLYLYKRLMNAT